MKNMMNKLPKHKFFMDPKSYRMAHPVYSMKDIEKVEVTHRDTKGIKDRIAYWSVQIARGSVDRITGYNPNTFTERDWLNRAIFLETVAGVPGMIGGM